MLESLVMLRSYRPRSLDVLKRRAAHDVYLLILSRLLELGAVRRASAVWACEEDSELGVGGVTVRFVRSFARVPAPLLRGDALLVRGDKRGYLPFLRRARFDRLLFYSAEESLLPSWSSGYDAVLVDEPEHVEVLRAADPRLLVLPFVKSADATVFRPLPGCAKEYDVCCIGSLANPKKNFDKLPAIMRALPGLRYLMVGRRDAAMEKTLSSATPHVTFAGHVTPEKLNELVNRSRVVLAMSSLDCSPRVLLETMAAGVPQVVNADMVSGPSYIRPGAGLLAPLDGFPRAIRAVLDEPHRFDPLRVFDEHFSLRHAAEVLRDAIARITPQRRSPFATWALHTLPVASLRHTLRRRGLPRLEGDPEDPD